MWWPYIHTYPRFRIRKTYPFCGNIVAILGQYCGNIMAILWMTSRTRRCLGGWSHVTTRTDQHSHAEPHERTMHCLCMPYQEPSAPSAIRHTYTPKRKGSTAHRCEPYFTFLHLSVFPSWRITLTEPWNEIGVKGGDVAHLSPRSGDEGRGALSKHPLSEGYARS